MGMPVSGVMWTVQEVAARWNVDDQVVRRLCQRGVLRSLTITRKCLRIPEEALLAYERKVRTENLRKLLEDVDRELDS